MFFVYGGRMDTNVIQIVIEAVILILAAFAVIRTAGEIKTETPEVYETMKAVCERVVRAAEQIYTSGRGQEKKQYAIDAVQKYLKANNITLDLSLIEPFIEAAVMDMNVDAWRMNVEAASMGWHPEQPENRKEEQ